MAIFFQPLLQFTIEWAWLKPWHKKVAAVGGAAAAAALGYHLYSGASLPDQATIEQITSNIKAEHFTEAFLQIKSYAPTEAAYKKVLDAVAAKFGCVVGKVCASNSPFSEFTKMFPASGASMLDQQATEQIVGLLKSWEFIAAFSQIKKHAQTEEAYNKVLDDIEAKLSCAVDDFTCSDSILKFKELFPANINQKDINNGTTPLIRAAIDGDYDRVSVLLDNGAQVDLSSGYGTALMSVISTKRARIKDRIEIVKLLIEKGADVNVQDSNGNTALMNAVRTDNIEMVRIILNAGAYVSLEDNFGFTALDLAGSKLINLSNREEIKKVLLEAIAAKADVDVRNKDGETRLHKAVAAGKIDVVQALLKAGVSPNISGKNGESLLQKAIAMGKVDMVKALLEAGADAKNKDGDMLLHKAVEMDDIGLVKLLLDRGADANAVNEDGDTLLHRAIGVDVINALIKAGANLNAQDRHGNTALTNADHIGATQKARILREAQNKQRSTWPDEKMSPEAKEKYAVQKIGRKTWLDAEVPSKAKKQQGAGPDEKMSREAEEKAARKTRIKEGKLSKDDIQWAYKRLYFSEDADFEVVKERDELLRSLQPWGIDELDDAFKILKWNKDNEGWFDFGRIVKGIKDASYAGKKGHREIIDFKTRAYWTLGLDRGADLEAVKKAYRALVATEHPDKKLNDLEANEKFRNIQNAYEELAKYLKPKK